MPLVKKQIMTCIFTLFLCLTSSVAFAAFERGDEGQEVLSIQKRLVELHYTISNLDGDFGPETEKAVKKFQADTGLDVDGVIGPATYKALMNKEMPPNRNDAKLRNILRAAYSVIGTPYVFGGTTPYGLIAQDLPNMPLLVQVFLFPEQLMFSSTLAVRYQSRIYVLETWCSTLLMNRVPLIVVFILAMVNLSMLVLALV